MLLQLARVHRARLVMAYLLTAGGMIAGLLYPFATGLAINGVLSGAYGAILWLVGVHGVQLVLTMASKRMDTRIFTRIYAVMATDIVERSRAAGLAPDRIAARVALSREYVVFLEEDVQRALYAGIAIVVSIGALFLLAPNIAAACLALSIPLLFVSRWLARRSALLNHGLNNRLEREVGLLGTASTPRVRRHFRALGGWRIKLSDAEASAFGLMELLVILLFVVALWQVGSAESQPRAGDIFALFAYMWRFVESLDQVPILVQKLAKLRDLDTRLAAKVD